jgi:hypothetical protein
VASAERVVKCWPIDAATQGTREARNRFRLRYKSFSAGFSLPYSLV